MNDLKKIKDAKVISKVEQKAIKGGIIPRGELCSDTYPIVVCYLPTHCAIGPDGTSICV